MKRNLLKGLSEEQVAKIKACKNNEELLALVDVELTQLGAQNVAVTSSLKIA